MKSQSPFKWALQKSRCLLILSSLILLPLSSLHAVTIGTGASTVTWSGNSVTASGADNIAISDITSRLSSNNVTINITGDVTISNITATNTGTAHTLTINATGNVNAGSFDLHGANGSGATTSACNGKAGHSLVIDAAGTVTITGAINTKGGNGGKPTNWDNNGGTGGAGGNVTIKGASGLNVAGVSTSGGDGGEYYGDFNVWKSGGGGNAGSVVLESSNGDITTASGQTINTVGGNPNSTVTNLSPGAPGVSGDITITAKNNINIGTAIIANGSNAGSCTQDCTNAFNGPDAKSVTITSSDGAITVTAPITANGGNGAGQDGLANGQKITTDGGKGGTITISSKLDLTISGIITVNGGLPGNPTKNPVAAYNQLGTGGAGGTVILSSASGDVTTAKIQADGGKGGDVIPLIDANGSPAGHDKGGTGGTGGSVKISAPDGSLTVNDLITTKGGNGGDYYYEGCGGNGGDPGKLDLGDVCGGITYDNGTPNYTYNNTVKEGNKGTVGQSGSTWCSAQNGTASPGNLIMPTNTNNLPTLKTPVLTCGGSVLTPDSLLNTGDTAPAGSVWQIQDGSGNWVDITLPYNMTSADNGKDIRLKSGCYTSNSITLSPGNSDFITIIEKDGKTHVGVGDAVTLSSSLNGLDLIWTINGVDVATPVFPMPLYQDVCVSVRSSDGCYIADKEYCITVGFPTAITPASNDHNSYLLKGSPYKMYVFNRHGVTMFTGTGGWDGKYDGKIVEPGVYYYVIDLPNGETRKATIEVVKEKK